MGGTACGNLAPRGTLMDRLTLRGGIAFIWLFTGLAVLHPFYRSVGGLYLARLSLPDGLMYAACVAEVVLGLCVLLFPPRLWMTALQLAMIAAFTLILAVTEPELLVNPFGVLSKNVTLAALIVTAQLVESEGWTGEARRVLLGGLAFIWAWEGVMACALFQGPTLREVLAFTGLETEQLRLLLIVAGIGQALGGVALLMLRGPWLRLLLGLQAVGLLLICVLVTRYEPRLWFHPFGPVSKNVPLILGTLLAFSREPLASASPTRLPEARG